MAYFIAGDDGMAPRMIEICCPNCGNENEPIPADMGDRIIHCKQCGKFIRYAWRKNIIEITHRPERATASGLTFY